MNLRVFRLYLGHKNMIQQVAKSFDRFYQLNWYPVAIKSVNMGEHKKYIVFTLLLLLFNSSIYSHSKSKFSSIENHPQWLAGISLSTFGAGIGGQIYLSNRFKIRSGISYFKYRYPLEKVRDDLVGDIVVSPSGVSINLDYWLYKNLFLSAGTVLNFTKILIDGKLSEAVLIGDIAMLPDEVGQINAELAPRYFLSPYLGVGFERVITRKKNVSFLFESGILFHGKPTVKLDATGMLTPTASDAQETLIEENVSSLSLYPILSISLYYTFIK